MAAKQQKGLGRGLDAIFSSEDAVAAAAPKLTGKETPGAVGELDIALLTPNPLQPRVEFDQDALAELADSIRVLGVIQPITVKAADNGRYVIISGERRWRASQMAGMSSIPAYVRAADDNQSLHEMALVENIQRQDLGPMEVALSLNRLMEECGLTQDQLAERVGKKRSSVANYLRLLNLPSEVQAALKDGIITMGHAKAIAAVPLEKQLPLLKKVMNKGLSVRKTEELVALNTNHEGDKTSTRRKEDDEKEFPESYARLVEILEKLFSDDIAIKGNKIVIGFGGEQDIEKFIKALS